MKKKLILLVLPLAINGCVVDELKTTMTIDPITHSVKWMNHKDITASGVTFYQTNNANYMHIDSISSASNVGAIGAQANLNQVTITAQGDTAVKLVGAIGTAMGQVGGSAAGAAIKTP